MLIMGQNKNAIVNTETNKDIYVMYGEKEIKTDDCLLGVYKDYEECEEVIALIYQAYASGNRVFMMPQSEVSE